jgi:Asp-tRNA(Asn)/Glu-tRNA(Gln) amidotransferase A subunit family amidase
MLERFTLAGMAEGVRGRKFSSTELVESHLRRIAALNPELNAFVEVFEEQALVQARRAGARLAEGRPTGRLHGVPVSIKDCFDVADSPTRAGSLLRRGEIAREDSWAAARLREEGAILLGKTSTPEFLYNFETDNHYVGPARNPWDRQCTAGGSSGGEAAAIAAFCSPGGVGSDGGGSIREPAHFCGICGLKPTPGRVPAAGHWPVIGHPAGFMGVAGPMARTAADTRLLFEVLAGYDERDPFSVPHLMWPSRSEGVRVAVMAQYGGVPVQPVMREAVARAAALLAGMGHEVAEFDFDLIRGAHELWWYLFAEAPAPALRAMFAGREAETHWTGTELIGPSQDRPEATAGELYRALARRDALRARLLAAMDDAPVILAPAFGVQAFPLRQRRFSTPQGEIELLDAARTGTFANLFGLPSVTVPVMVSGNGLPAGVQFAAAPYGDELVLDLAVRFEQARGEFDAPPEA